MPLVERAFRGKPVTLPEFEYDAGPAFEAAGLPVVGAKKRWVRSHLYPVLDADGEVNNVVDVEEDITGRKQAEENLRTYQGRLRALAAELTITEERERRRIAADLHDNVGQSLALARVQLGTAKKLVQDDRLRNMLDQVSESMLDVGRDTRHLIGDLSSPTMHELGLAAGIAEWLEEQIGKRQGLETLFVDDCGAVPLEADARAILFRTVRELLTNVVKHAKANAVTVRMKRASNSMSIAVEDDGNGFDPAEVFDSTGKEGGFGLFSVRERMANLGGSLEIISAPGHGCKVILTAPLTT
jgi:signal transduction histidine kinase